ncbi:MAG: pirin family protein [Acidobacteria bacterium]|nr:MAG: pirin family protein [Acidobacteriota bacterium]REK01411.1 MAG: pirin family protein [Acidobacteriota bacterium]REK14367.1 MAG: pirin family protein [Acidobacteriota bacterium]REK45082.1 MAG: pirin family protein [Acidobacteriota bacterium]
MRKIRKAAKVVRPTAMQEGAGVLLKRVIGTNSLSYVDPFLLLDHFGSDEPDDYMKGFPDHPHRGIETVTYMLSGSSKHRDSEGNEGIIESGGVQWMTAGSGIIHEEMPQLDGEKLEGFQLWVNLPAKSKMMKPRYREFKKDEIPKVEKHSGERVRVIAGEYEGIEGAITELEAAGGFLDVDLPPEEGFKCQTSRSDNAVLYIYEGSGEIEGERYEGPVLIVLEEGELVHFVSGTRGARFLLIFGEPLDEPIARYGPFVMNTREEIATALEELSKGEFVK